MVTQTAKVDAQDRVAIRTDLRRALSVKQGDKPLFVANDRYVVLNAASLDGFLKATASLRRMKKKINESEVVDVIHALRQKRHARQ